MVVLGIMDVRGIIPERVGDVSQNQLFLRAKEVKNTDEARLKIGAYVLLSHLAREYMGADVLPEIYYTPMGKPYFKENSDWQFNISHDRDLCAVILSNDYSALGVDLQSMPDRKIRLERIRERFFAPLNYLSGKERDEGQKANTLPLLLKFFTAIEQGGTYATAALEEPTGFDIIFYEDTAELDFLTKWTLLEATVKATGEGISTYRDTEKLDTHTSVYAFRRDGHTFSLSAAAVKQER